MYKGSPETPFASGRPTDLRVESERTQRVAFHGRFHVLHFSRNIVYRVILLIRCYYNILYSCRRGRKKTVLKKNSIARAHTRTHPRPDAELFAISKTIITCPLPCYWWFSIRFNGYYNDTYYYRSCRGRTRSIIIILSITCSRRSRSSWRSCGENARTELGHTHSPHTYSASFSLGHFDTHTNNVYEYVPIYTHIYINTCTRVCVCMRCTRVFGETRVFAGISLRPMWLPVSV